MADGSLARRYARALASLGQDAGLTDVFVEQLDAFLGVIQSEGGLLDSVLANPGLTTVERRAVLDQVLQRLALHDHVRSFLKLLVDKNRFAHLAEIHLALREMADEQANRVRAEVTSARPLSPAMVEQVRRSLEARTGRVVVLRQRVDPHVLGGLVVSMGGTVYDASIRARLESVEAALLRSPIVA